MLFDDGYFIDNENNKVKCLIELGNWRIHPKKIAYKTTADGEVKTLMVNEIKEFGLGDGLFERYISRIVEIDKSRDDYSMLSTERNPVFNQEHLFLKEIVTGTASLYEFNDKNRKRYFYSIEDGPLKQLVWKEYRLPEGQQAGAVGKSTIQTNRQFRQQLINTLSCSKNSSRKLKSIKYIAAELKPYFINYNECKDPNYVYRSEAEIKVQKSNSDLFNMWIKPGFKVSYLNTETSAFPFDNYLFGYKPGFRFGLDFEFFPRYNNSGKQISKTKWCFIAEPVLQTFSASDEASYVQSAGVIETDPLTVTYKSVDFTFGLRYYFSSSENLSFHVDASRVAFDILNEGNILFEKFTFSNAAMTPGGNWRFGIGATYSDKFSASVNYHSRRDLFAKTKNWVSAYRTLELVFGYKLF